VTAAVEIVVGWIVSGVGLGTGDLSFLLGIGRQNFLPPHVSLLLAQLSSRGCSGQLVDPLSLLLTVMTLSAFALFDAETVARFAAWSALA